MTCETEMTAERHPVTVAELMEMRRRREPIVMVTAYDHPTARIAEAAGVDVVLVGDSAANNVLGYDDTVPITVDELLMLSGAVRRGLRIPLLVGDLPFGSYEASDERAVLTAQRFIKEARVDAVKLEGGIRSASRVSAITAAGIPVMGNIGLTPQTASISGGYRVQGKSADSATHLFEDAGILQEAGCFALVVEAVPASVASLLVEQLEIPVIGIGAGASTDGQVLVFHDIV